MMISAEVQVGRVLIDVVAPIPSLGLRIGISKHMPVRLWEVVYRMKEDLSVNRIRGTSNWDRMKQRQKRVSEERGHGGRQV